MPRRNIKRNKPSKNLSIANRSYKTNTKRKSLTETAKSAILALSKQNISMEIHANIKVFTKLLRDNPTIIRNFLVKTLTGLDGRFDGNIDYLVRDLGLVNDDDKVEIKRLLMRTSTNIPDKSKSTEIMGLGKDTGTTRMINQISSNDRKLSLQLSGQSLGTVVKGLETNVDQYQNILKEIHSSHTKYEVLDLMAKEITESSSEKWVDLSTLYSSDANHIGISIDIRKLEKISKITKLTGETLYEFLRSAVVKTPEITIKIGKFSLLISTHMLLAMVDLMIQCSEKFIAFKDTLLGIAGFTDKYSPKLFYVFYSLFLEPVFTIKDNPTDDPKKIHMFYVFRIYSNLFATCYFLGKKYHTGDPLDQSGILNEGLSVLSKASSSNSIPNIQGDQQSNDVFEYMANIIPYLLLKYTSSQFGTMTPVFNQKSGAWDIFKGACPSNLGARRTHHKKKHTKKHKKKHTKKHKKKKTKKHKKKQTKNMAPR